MAKRLLFCVFTGATILFSSVIAAGSLDWRDDVRSSDRVRYDAGLEQVYEGAVGTKGHVVEGLMYFALRISDSTVEVQIGPEDFVTRSGFKFKIGEMATVVGMPLAWNGRDIVVARQVSNITSVLSVRDRDGYPMWDMTRPVKMDPELSYFHLCEMIEP
jgi:hypothetical protein